MRLSAIAVLLMTTAAFAENVPETDEPADRSGIYYCRPSATAGMIYDNAQDTWNATIFKTSTDGFAIKVRSTGIGEQGSFKARIYSILLKTTQTGDFRTCSNESFGPDVVSVNDRAECRWIAQRYQFDLEYLRYETWSEGSYLQLKDKQTLGLPYLELGKCEKVD